MARGGRVRGAELRIENLVRGKHITCPDAPDALQSECAAFQLAAALEP